MRILVLLTGAALLAACSQTTSSEYEDEYSFKSSSSQEKNSSTSKSKQSSNSTNDDKSSDSDNELGEECVGEAGIPWDGTTAKEFACGTGTKLNPYIILTAEQLAHLSFIVGSKDTEYNGSYYKLGADILLNKGEIINDKGALIADSTKLHKWTPIGNSSVTFIGNFDGDGHSISGMFINTTSSHNGLFGNNQGTISNLILKDSWITGGKITGGLTGQNGGTIDNVENYATITGTSDCSAGIAGQSNGPYPKKALISNATNYGVIQGRDYTGGITGQAYQSTIENSANFGEIEGSSNVGGIVGRGGRTYVSSYFFDATNVQNYGKINGTNNVGGIIGSAGYVSPSISSGNIIATLNDSKNEGNVIGKDYVGGIIGGANRVTLHNAGNKALIEGEKYVSGVVGNLLGSNSANIYNTGNVTGTIYVGGIIGHNEEGVTSSAYSTGKVDGDSLVGLMIGYNYNTTMADYYYLEQGKQEPFGLNNSGGVATPKSSDEMKSEKFAELLGDDFIYDPDTNSGYPILSWELE